MCENSGMTFASGHLRLWQHLPEAVGPWDPEGQPGTEARKAGLEVPLPPQPAPLQAISSPSQGRGAGRGPIPGRRHPAGGPSQGGGAGHRSPAPGSGAGSAGGRARTAPGLGALPAVEFPHAVQLRGLGPGQDHLPRQLHGSGPPGPRPPPGPLPAGYAGEFPLLRGASPGGGACVVRGGSCEPIGFPVRGRRSASAVEPPRVSRLAVAPPSSARGPSSPSAHARSREARL